MRRTKCVLGLVFLTAAAITAQARQAAGEPTLGAQLAAAAGERTSELAGVVTRYVADRGALLRMYEVEGSPARRERLRRFGEEWLGAMERIDFDALSREGKVDYILLHGLAAHDLRRLDIDAKKTDAAMTHAPFAGIVYELGEARRTLAPIDGEKAAGKLVEIRKQVEGARKAFEEKLKPGADGTPGITASDAKVVLRLVEGLRWWLRSWHDFYNEYDPMFTWWTRQPFGAADGALDQYARLIREKGMGITPENPNVIVGVPIGREALLSELKYEMIPYAPEELIGIAERELEWCRGEYAKAAGEMGVADWRAALEKVKEDHVAPGEQPALIRDLTREAIAYVRENDLVTIPALAEETWRMDMMSPQRQLQTPFFTGGEVISVAFPTIGMEHEIKEMALRGNNIHFSRATVFHELFPGHGLQAFSQERHNTHRGVFGTAFWTEGWSLYWEMLLWDKGFTKTPEDRVGALFWRSHRCARIICSLKYHLGEMSTPEWIDFLVNEIGHERSTAEGEVRRSVSGDYGPLYQVGYLIGGKQFRAMHAEVVGRGLMSEREFHDRVMGGNSMPVEMVRALIEKTPLTREYEAQWRFEDVGGSE